MGNQQMIKSILFHTKRLITIVLTLLALYGILLLCGYSWQTMKDFFPMVSILITVGLNELFLWIDNSHEKKQNKFETTYISPIFNCVSHIKSKSFRSMQDLSNLYKKDSQEARSDKIADIFKDIHEQLGDIHNCMKNLESDLNNKKPNLVIKMVKHMKNILSDRWKNHKEKITMLSDYMLIIKEEISEYNEKLLKYSATDDFAKIGELEKDIRSDVELFFGDLSKILESIKNKY